MRRPLRVLVPALAIAAAATAAALVHKQLTDPVRPGAEAPVVEGDARWLRPAPTEHWLSEDAESVNKQRRKDWIEHIHKAPPGVDYRSLIRANGLAQVAKRNALALMPAPPIKEQWVERGSANQAGRMHVARLGSDGASIYAGSSRGGVWRGSLEGSDWEPIGDNLYGGAHWLEVLAAQEEGDPDIVIAATDGGLVHYSVDDGESWQEPSGLPSGLLSVRRLLRQSDGSDTLFLVGCDWNDCGLFRSQDLGVSFEQVQDLGGYLGDLWTPRDGGSELYLVHDDELWKSEDRGEEWEVIGDIAGGSSRAELTGSEAGAPTLYAVLDGEDLYRSVDGGSSWEWRHEVSDYWSTLNVSQQDPELVAWGGVQVYRSADGGESFAMVNEWWVYYDDPANLLHADIPGLDVLVDGDGLETWYICTDGGLYVSEDGLQSVRNLSLDGLRVSQYYGTLTSSENPDHIAAGAQDQGYQVTNTMEQPDGTLRDFEQVVSGDYGHLTSSDGSHEYVYSVYPGFVLVQIGADNPILDYAEFPSGERYVSWLPPIVADPDDPLAYFFPATRIYRYARRGGRYEGDEHSDESLDLQGEEYVSALAFSALDSQRAWVATSQGRLFASEDHGVSWRESSGLGPDGNWYYGHALLPSISDPDTIWVGGSGYGGVTAVYRSQDGGTSWEGWGDGLPAAMVYCLCQAPDGSGRLFAGTDTAAYMRQPDSEAWVDITAADAPITTYWSCESLVHENTIRFATYGRGIWDYQLDPEHAGCYPVQDYDGDGVLCDEDCDDHDPAVLPGAEDICDDGVDQDCSGSDRSCDTGGGTKVTGGGGCGCASAGGGGALLGLLGLLGLALQAPGARARKFIATPTSRPRVHYATAQRSPGGRAEGTRSPAAPR